MSQEPITKIPGSTYSLKFGIEGKYYALYLCRGSQPFRTKQLNILRGTSLKDLPEEIENGIRFLLDSEQIFLSQIIVKRVMNDLLEQIPKESSQTFAKETSIKSYVQPTITVQELISKSDERAEQKSVLEFTQSEKIKYDATAEDIGRIVLKEPKPLHKKGTTAEIPQTKPQSVSKTDYVSLEQKVNTLSNEIVSLHTQIDKNNQEITDLKMEITSIKKETDIIKDLSSKKSELEKNSQ